MLTTQYDGDGSTHHLNQSANGTDNGNSSAVSSVEAALPALSAHGKAGLIIGISLACVVLFSAAAVLFRCKNADRRATTYHLQQQQQGPTGVVQNKIFSAAEYESWSGQQWQLDYDNGLVPGAADHPTPRQSWLVQAGRSSAPSTDYLAPVVGGGSNVVYAIPLDTGGGAGIGGNARRETVYAMPTDAPKHVLLDADGYVAGGEMPRGSPSGGDNGAIIYAVAAVERSGGRQAVSNLTYGAPAENDSSV